MLESRMRPGRLEFHLAEIEYARDAVCSSIETARELELDELVDVDKALRHARVTIEALVAVMESEG